MKLKLTFKGTGDEKNLDALDTEKIRCPPF